jgi:transposase
MVKTPHPSSHLRETAVHAEYHYHSTTTQGPHHRDETRKTPEQEAEEAHHRRARCRWFLAHRDRSRALLLLSTTLYAIVDRFTQKRRTAFDDRQRRGPKPLLKESANERIECLVEGESPAEHGWLRSPASLELQAHRPPTL